MKYLLTLALILILSNTFGQKRELDTAIYIITDAKINGVDQSEYYRSSEQFIAFYRDKDNKPTFLNSHGDGKEFSIGPMTNIEFTDISENEVKKTHIKFSWRYENSYNDEYGNAVVNITKTFEKENVIFFMTIVTKDLEVIEFSGYTDDYKKPAINNG